MLASQGSPTVLMFGLVVDVAQWKIIDLAGKEYQRSIRSQAQAATCVDMIINPVGKSASSSLSLLQDLFLL